jgi:hypothetical protein
VGNLDRKAKACGTKKKQRMRHLCHQPPKKMNRNRYDNLLEQPVGSVDEISSAHFPILLLLLAAEA